MSSINKKLIDIMRDVKAIGKDSVNQQQRFQFRGIDAVMNNLHPIFAKHGVIILPEVLEDKTEERQTKSGGNLIYRILKIKFVFCDEEGDKCSSTIIGEGMDSGDKAANKAMAIGLKYALTQMLLLPYDEIDPDAESHDVEPKPIHREQPKLDPEWVTECKKDKTLANAVKAAGLNSNDCASLWSKTDKNAKVPQAEQFAVLVNEIFEAKERSAIQTEN